MRECTPYPLTITAASQAAHDAQAVPFQRSKTRHQHKHHSQNDEDPDDEGPVPILVVPPAGLPKDGNGSDQQLPYGRLVIERTVELPGRVGSGDGWFAGVGAVVPEGTATNADVLPTRRVDLSFFALRRRLGCRFWILSHRIAPARGCRVRSGHLVARSEEVVRVVLLLGHS